MRHRRVWRLFFAGMIAALTLGLAAFVAFTRTVAGRERVLEYTLTTVGGRLNGHLDVERLEGNLVTGAKLYELVILDADSALILRADSAYANYELPSFFGGDAVLNELVLYSAEVALRRFPGDSLWNYQELLTDTTPGPADAPGRATIIENARLVDTRVTVRLPWAPDSTASAGEQAVEVREALADTSRLEVATHPDGYLRTMRFEVDDARISDLVISGDERGGTFVAVDSARARAYLYRGEPLEVRQVEGELALRAGVMRFSAPTVALPGSRLSARGVVDMSGGEPRYDLTVDADTVDLDDMAWLYPRLPEQGRASFGLTLETRPDGLYFGVRELRFSAPGTRVVGTFGAVMGEETLQFTGVDLTAQPLRVETIEQMLPQGLPVRGLHIGAVEIRSGDGAAAASDAA